MLWIYYTGGSRGEHWDCKPHFNLKKREKCIETEQKLKKGEEKRETSIQHIYLIDFMLLHVYNENKNVSIFQIFSTTAFEKYLDSCPPAVRSSLSFGQLNPGY